MKLFFEKGFMLTAVKRDYISAAKCAIIMRLKPWDTVAQAKTYIEKYEFPLKNKARLTVQHAMVHKNNLAGSSDKKL